MLESTYCRWEKCSVSRERGTARGKRKNSFSPCYMSQGRWRVATVWVYAIHTSLFFPHSTFRPAYSFKIHRNPFPLRPKKLRSLRTKMRQWMKQPIGKRRICRFYGDRSSTFGFRPPLESDSVVGSSSDFSQRMGVSTLRRSGHVMEYFCKDGTWTEGTR